MAKISQCSTKFEAELFSAGFRLIAGIDEVGRGALAGPVVAAAVILDLTRLPTGLDDSKRLTRRQRERLAAELEGCTQAIAVMRIEPAEIDSVNIHQASLKAMAQAVAKLQPAPDYLLIDGFPLKAVSIAQQAIIRGDALCASIAAASIIAKVTRDHIMHDYDQQWPGYGFANNVGYGTPAHLASLRKLGPTPIHRRSFHGVWVSEQPLLPLSEETQRTS
ncbi:MAG: ribonuclease HII [Acidobacteriota bacterium]